MIDKKIRQAASFILSLAILLVPAPSRGQARKAPERAGNGSSKPRLAVVIVIDQFRYDYLERFLPYFGKNGFRRLISQGALFANANYNYVPTYTAPGHASIFTGSVPAQNGIVGNSWFDRGTGAMRVMVSDSSARLVNDSGVTGDPGAASPRALIGTTIGDQLRLSNNLLSKVVAVSLKDRSAVLPGGQRPNGAFWYSDVTGTFVSSDYYSRELPEWVRRFNAARRPDKYFNAKWDRLLPADAYKASQSSTLPVQRSPLGKGFPYVVNGGLGAPGQKFYDAFEFTPFASEYLADFSKAAVEAEALGADDHTDLLSVSFSSPDLVGHSFGPDSPEILDIYARLDLVIADLVDYFDKRVGLANMVIAVTGDHGVSPVPEYAASVGMDANRISSRVVLDAVNKALADRFGEGKWVLGFVNDQIYLNLDLIAEKKLSPASFEAAAGEAALKVTGIVNFFTRSQIVEGRMPQSRLARLVANGFNRERSGDIWIVTRPFYFISEGLLATTHGSPYNYDTHVPVLFFGRGVRAGKFFVEASPSDIAPTLAALLGVEPPSNVVGRALVDALAERE
ncbi:MAG TPA: alkaline phosphatase family protein [Blastocatellia bacterium]|jgi:predicted AlkP superfamily pyrophosphatase or phosphodiesterase|nr:alkaline phosphatase family protein [Blastocatellia bacterium]